MAEKDKGFSFRSLFFRDAETDPQERQITEQEPVTNKPQADYYTNAVIHAPVGIQEQPLVED